MSGRRRLVLKVALLCMSCLVALGVAELGLRLFLPQDLSGSYREVAPRGYLVSRASTTSQDQYGERVVTFRFNAQHLRGGPLGEATHRVLVLGDSYTFGWLLAEEDTFVAHLASWARRDFGPQAFEFMNGGGGGWGTADYLAFVEDFGEELRPSLVLVFLNAEDVSRSVRSGLYSLADRESLELRAETVLQPKGRLKTVVNAVPFYRWLLQHSHVTQLLRRTVLGQGLTRRATKPAPLPAAAADDAIVLAQALFRRLAAWCRTHDAELLVVTTGFFESHAQAAWGGWDAEVNRPFLQRAEAIFAEEEIPFVDTSAAVLELADGQLEALRIPGDGHPNEAGALVIARASWTSVKAQLETLNRR